MKGDRWGEESWIKYVEVIWKEEETEEEQEQEKEEKEEKEEEEEEGWVWEAGKVLTEPSHLEPSIHTRAPHTLATGQSQKFYWPSRAGSEVQCNAMWSQSSRVSF